MRTLWVTMNTTCLEPSACNLLELSVGLQVDGALKYRRDWKIKPILHHDDSRFGKLSPQKFLEAYHSWLPTKDPRCTLEPFTVYDGADPLFFYSAETLRYLETTPLEIMADERADPSTVIKQLLEMLDGSGKWTLVGHSVGYIETALKNWTARTDWTKTLQQKLESVVDFSKSIDTLQFFRVLAAFNPEISRRGFGLRELATSMGEFVGGSAESKLTGLMASVEKVVSGGFKVGNGTSGTSSS